MNVITSSVRQKSDGRTAHTAKQTTTPADVTDIHLISDSWDNSSIKCNQTHLEGNQKTGGTDIKNRNWFGFEQRLPVCLLHSVFHLPWRCDVRARNDVTPEPTTIHHNRLQDLCWCYCRLHLLMKTHHTVLLASKD